MVIADSPFKRMRTFIDGKNQLPCMVMLGNTLVFEACRKLKLMSKSSTEARLVAYSRRRTNQAINYRLRSTDGLRLGHECSFGLPRQPVHNGTCKERT